MKQRGLEEEKVRRGEMQGAEDADRLEEHGEVGGVRPGGPDHQLLQLPGDLLPALHGERQQNGPGGSSSSSRG